MFFETPQSNMSRKSFSTPFYRVGLDGAFNFLLKCPQTILLVIDADPNDTRRTGIRKEADPLRAQMQWRRPGTGCANGFPQAGDLRGGNVAEEPEREMKLFWFRPSDHITRHQSLQFALNANHFLAYRARDCIATKSRKRPTACSPAIVLI